MTASDRHGPVGPRMLLPQLVAAAGFLAALGWLLAFEHAQLSQAIARAGHAKPGLIVAAAGCEWASMVALAWAQRRLLWAAGQRVTVAAVIGITFAGAALSSSVPLAGSGLSTAFTYRQLRHQTSDAIAAVALLVSGVLSILSLVAVMAAGALASGNTAAGILGAAGAAAVATGTAGFVLGLRVPAGRHLIERAAISVVRVAQRLRHTPGAQPEAVVAHASRQLGSMDLRRIDWAVAAGLAAANWLGDAGCLALSLAAARLAVPLRDLLLVWSAGAAASTFCLTPGGVGVVDVALVAALAGLRVPAAGAVAGVLIYRLISLWLVLAAGWIFFVFIRFQRSKAVPGKLSLIRALLVPCAEAKPSISRHLQRHLESRKMA